MNAPPLKSGTAATSKEAAAQLSNHKEDARFKRPLQSETSNATTLGFSIFRDPLANPLCIADIRARLELKYAACVALGGLNGQPVDVDMIQNPQLRSLGSIGRLVKNWSVRDLAEIHGLPALTAEAVLIATLERPVWGEDEVALLRMLERLEHLQSKAERSGRTL